LILNTQNKLPKDWQIKPLGEVCKIVSGNTPKGIENISNTGNYQFYKVSDMNSLGNEVKMTHSNYNLSNEEVVKLKLKLYPKGTIIFPKRGGAILTNKKRVLSKDSTFDLNLMGVLPNENVNSSFLFYWFINLDLGKICDGSNIPQINNKNIAPLDFPIPPIETQQVIVSKIEELFSELDKGIEDLKTAQQQLKTYRQSVLKWAFEGKLSPLTPKRGIKEGELPKGWEWTTFQKVCVKIGDIDHKMPKQLEKGYPYVSTKDFTNDLKISFDNAKYISKEDYINLSRKIKPEKGDIIFPRYGTIGKNILVDFDKEFLVSYSCAVVKPNHDIVLSKYIYLYSLSPKVTDEIRKYVVETTQANIGIASIKSFVFPLSPIEEQHQIVQEIESRLSVADKMEESIAQSLQQAEALRQSILKKAFSGELVEP